MPKYAADINSWAVSGGMLIAVGLYELAKGYYISGALTALTGAAIAFVEYRIETERERRDSYRNEISDFFSRNMRN
ncbi:MAG: hypothetical protein HY517_00950 [Candidatus Aenigmarchaeota archaeon]|nr:hypothetical protein [Candidatus Aenigmarchaeota archaeon]